MMPAMAAQPAEEGPERPEGARVIAMPAGGVRKADATQSCPPSSGKADRVLLERHRRGDPDAFAALMATFRAPVFGYLTRCGVATADRDDLFQEVFLRVHRAAGPDGTSELPTGALAPWLFTIAVNLVRSHFRKAGVRKIMTLDGAAGETTASASASPERALESRRELAWLEDAMEKLPLEQREALVLSSIDGMELAEIATALEVPAETVKTRVRRARLALAEARVRANVRAEREEAR
jgi:RNA polymerase sigma-70 factor (ECF subfamily)